MRSHGVQDIACIGVVAPTGRFIVHGGEQVLIDLTVADLQEAWKTPPVPVGARSDGVGLYGYPSPRWDALSGGQVCPLSLVPPDGGRSAWEGEEV